MRGLATSGYLLLKFLYQGWLIGRQDEGSDEGPIG